MIEVLGGVAGGLGIFFVGMWLLTENLKTLATRRLRLMVHRWTGNPLTAIVWGAIAGAVTQSMSAMTFIVVSVLRAGLISTRGAFAILLGGGVGLSMLVLVLTFDIEVVALYVLGAAGAVLISERASRYRPVAASFFGGAMIVLGLVLLKNAVAPLAEDPWFAEMVERTDGSLLLVFTAGALLTAIVQSSSAVCANGGAKVDHGSGGMVLPRRSKTLPVCQPFPVMGRVGGFTPWSCIARFVWRAGTG